MGLWEHGASRSKRFLDNQQGFVGAASFHGARRMRNGGTLSQLESQMQVPLPADVETAANRISPWVTRTPIHRSRQLDQICGAEVFLKCESFQRGGAFKFRGACNAVAALDPESRSRGVVTHSSGNHAAALAIAAGLHRIPAFVVMPQDASRVKREAVVAYGGTVIACESNLESRERTAAEVMARTNAALVHPYDDTQVIAGQGTAARELLEQVPDLDAVVAPIGGGGLISGCVLAAKACPHSIAVWGAEPLGADDAYRSKLIGERLLATQVKTIADGLRTSLGKLTWPFVRDDVEGIVTTSDEQIVTWMRWIWERMKIVIEPSSATAIAALFDPRWKERGYRRVGIIISGGNLDLSSLPW